MKHTLFILLTATLFILACGETRNNDSKTDSSRAERIADSLRDYNQLNLWVDHFDSIGDHKAELLIRQKLGKVMRDRSDFEAAIKQHDTCIAMATELKDTLHLRHHNRNQRNDQDFQFGLAQYNVLLFVIFCQPAIKRHKSVIANQCSTATR